MIFKTKPKATAALILCLGTLLIFPPIILIFNKPLTLLGIPISAIYLFSIWLVVIICSAFSSRHLPDPNE